MSLTDAVDAGFARGTDEGVRAFTGQSKAAVPTFSLNHRGVVQPKN